MPEMHGDLMVFLAAERSNDFNPQYMEAILYNQDPFFMVRLKHPEERHGRVMQGSVIKPIRAGLEQFPSETLEVLYMPGVRGLRV